VQGPHASARPLIVLNLELLTPNNKQTNNPRGKLVFKTFFSSGTLFGPSCYYLFCCAALCAITVHEYYEYIMQSNRWQLDVRERVPTNSETKSLIIIFFFIHFVWRVQSSCTLWNDSWNYCHTLYEFV